MDFIFMKPERWAHIREIARKVKLSPNTVRKSLTNLIKKGIVEKRKQGNMLQFRGKLDSKNYKIEKKIHNLRHIYKTGIVDYLFDFYNPKAIVLFGSYSRGEDISTSDVDIGIITVSKKRPDLSPFERKIGRKIELSLFNKKEVSNEFFNNIINGIVLKGILKNE